MTTADLTGAQQAVAAVAVTVAAKHYTSNLQCERTVWLREDA